MNRHFLLAAAMMAATNTNAQDIVQDTLQNIVVTGTRNATEARHIPFTVTTLDNEKLNENYRAAVLPTIVEQTPGFFATSRGMLGYGVNTGAGTMKIRGVGGGAELLVLIDGQPQYAGLMGHPVPDAYQTMMAEKVEVLRGPASLLYGSNAMAGVINIVTRQMHKDGIVTDIQLQGGSYGTLQIDVSSRLKKGKFSSIIGAQYQRTDGHRTNSKFEQFGGFFKLTYDISSHWKATGDINVTHFNTDNPGTTDEPLIDNTFKITRGLASISLNNSYALTSGSLRAYFDWGHHNIDDGYAAGQTPRTSLYKHNDYIGGLTYYQSAQLFNGNRTTIGIDWQHFGGSAWNADKTTGAKTYLTKDSEGNIIKSQHADEIAAYADFRQDITHWLTLDAGLRIDHHSVIGTELIPQAGLAFHLGSYTDIKALASKGFRNPVIKEMYMFPPANTQLKPERMMNYELSLTQRFGAKGQFNANIFYIDGENLITTTRIDGRPRNVNMGNFKNWGIELAGSYDLSKHWRVNANYSFLNMENPVEGAPENKFYAGVNFHKGKWSIASGLQSIGGLYIATGEHPEQENYTLLNATASYRITPSATCFLKGENLLAEQYQTFAGFPMPKATFMGGMKLTL